MSPFDALSQVSGLYQGDNKFVSTDDRMISQSNLNISCAEHKQNSYLVAQNVQPSLNTMHKHPISSTNEKIASTSAGRMTAFQ